MTDGLLDLIFILILLAPVGGALGSAVMMWWRAASSRRAAASSAAEDSAAEVTAVGLFPDGAGHCLRLANQGQGPAHDLQVFVNRDRLSGSQDEAQSGTTSAVAPGQSRTYQYPGGGPSGRDRVLVRIEWDDARGGGVEQTTLRVP